jgi:hypothetical protein
LKGGGVLETIRELRINYANGGHATVYDNEAETTYRAIEDAINRNKMFTDELNSATGRVYRLNTHQFRSVYKSF